ncbi:MAG TPA: LON peptidase substrate-binding domain-containing protein [Planctomycetota bacterium]
MQDPPPAPADRILPLFPLPNVLLYPDAILPLHVFEPRYVRLVEDLVDNSCDELVLALLVPDHDEDYFEHPPVYPIAGVGKVLQVRDAGEGRYNILVQGLHRSRLHELANPALPYRTVRVTALPEPGFDSAGGADAATRDLAALLREGLFDFADGSLVLPSKAPAGYLADVLLVALPLDVQEKQRLFSILDVHERCRSVLATFEGLRQRRHDLDAARRHADGAPWN